jgi:hypothetical protein
MMALIHHMNTIVVLGGVFSNSQEIAETLNHNELNPHTKKGWI